MLCLSVESAVMAARNEIRRFGLSMLVAIVAFTIVNCVAYWLRTPPCCDWTYASGFRFRFMQEGGFVGVRRFLWLGVVADIGAIVAASLTINGAMTFLGRTKR